MKKAFTLAEVLITLGIVGVVSAMTIPTLVQNYQNRELEAKAKKTYSTLAQAFEELMRKNNAVTLSDTNFISDPYTALRSVLTVANTGSPQGYGIEGNDELTIDQDVQITFADGTYVTFSTPTVNNVGSQIIVDTNGEKRPNRFGRDVLVFYVMRNGDIVSGSQSGFTGSFATGASTTQTLMQNGWEISN